MTDLIDRKAVLDYLDIRNHDAEERDWRSGANEIARIRKAIAALPAQGVRVKPLEWATYDEGFFGNGLFNYVVLPGRKFEGFGGSGWRWSRYSSGTWYLGEENAPPLTEDTAKAAAQADYERRILAALEPAEAGGVEAHDEQLGVWTDELMADLALNSLMDLVDYEYDTKVGARRMIIDALKAANQAKVPQATKINWGNDPDAIVEDDEPQIGRDYA